MENHHLTTYTQKLRRLLPALLALIMLGSLISPIQAGAIGESGNASLPQETRGQLAEGQINTQTQSTQTDRSAEIRAKVEQAIEKTKNYYIQNPLTIPKGLHIAIIG